MAVSSCGSGGRVNAIYQPSRLTIALTFELILLARSARQMVAKTRVIVGAQPFALGFSCKLSPGQRIV